MLVLAMPQPAMASSSPGIVCTIAATALMFGAYIPYRTNSTDSTATIKVICTTSDTVVGQVSGSIALVGASPATDRHLIGNQSDLRFQLYLDPTRTRIWGNGMDQGSSVPISGVVGVNAPYRQTITVYGRIPPMAVAAVAAQYFDTITAVLDY
ncbi:spore coat protein U domain-containing protein [Novosphingobium sp.]|uniref:spore coat protein U domain-containing protein n=1 Tax=Novosphingobium sp. TaxID=1874826 RepID=UPI00333E889C